MNQEFLENHPNTQETQLNQFVFIHLFCIRLQYFVLNTYLK